MMLGITNEIGGLKKNKDSKCSDEKKNESSNRDSKDNDEDNNSDENWIK